MGAIMYVFYVGSGDLLQIHRLARQVLLPAEPPLWLCNGEILLLDHLRL